jgi:hypothetical protein
MDGRYKAGYQNDAIKDTQKNKSTRKHLKRQVQTGSANA